MGGKHHELTDMASATLLEVEQGAVRGGVQAVNAVSTLCDILVGLSELP